MNFVSLARTVFRYQRTSRRINSPSISAEWLVLDKRFINTKFDRRNVPFRITIVSLTERMYVKFLSEVKSVNSSKELLHLINNSLSSLTLKLKEQSVNVVKLCTKQFECVVAHRIRRGQQVFSLYNKIWEEKALEDVISKMRKRLFSRGKELVFTACGVACFNWEKERISDTMMSSHMNEIDFVQRLKKATVVCTNCGNRLLIDRTVKNVEYCECGNSSRSTAVINDGDWVPFAERQDMLIWRREHESHSGLYMYKVYGRFEEISALDFLHVQIDTNYRLKWDRTVADLRVVDSDAKSHSEIIYWEVKWPHMFANRDYVFNRRFKMDKQKKRMVIVNKNTEHPSVPPKTGAVRVNEYWSYMVIKPLKDFTEPGIEFVLTYFDDPGLSMPSYVAGWVAMSALPDFLICLREASQPGKCHPEIRKGDTVPMTSLVDGMLQDVEYPGSKCESHSDSNITAVGDLSFIQPHLQQITPPSPFLHKISESCAVV